MDNVLLMLQGRHLQPTSTLVAVCPSIRVSDMATQEMCRF